MKKILLIIISLMGLLILRPFTAADAASLPSSPPPFYPPVVTAPQPVPPVNPPSVPGKPVSPSRNEPEKGVTNPRTGEYCPGATGGVINPRTGVFLPKVEGGYFNPETGDTIPKG